jgi:hypothetical protein
MHSVKFHTYEIVFSMGLEVRKHLHVFIFFHFYFGQTNLSEYFKVMAKQYCSKFFQYQKVKSIDNQQALQQQQFYKKSHLMAHHLTIKKKSLLLCLVRNWK